MGGAPTGNRHEGMGVGVEGKDVVVAEGEGASSGAGEKNFTAHLPPPGSQEYLGRNAQRH